MLKKVVILTFLFILFSGDINVYAYTESYSYSDYSQDSKFENGEYCSETNNKGIWNKLKNAFVGQPTGYTPQIAPSPYLNPYYGPSYQQGAYTGNRWNDHNVYYPQYPARLFGMSF